MAVNGTLKFLVLKVLSVEESNGISVLRKIERETGWRVSPGSLYPLMKDLVALHMVELKKNSDLKIYQITKKGRNFLESADEKKEVIRKKISECLSFLEVLDETKDFGNIKKRLKKNDFDFLPSREIIDRAHKLINQIDVEKHKKEIDKILFEMVRKLERLK